MTTPAGALLRHVHNHPWRLVATLSAILVVAWGLALYAFTISVDSAHQGRIDNCNSVNELSRKLYVTFSDLGFAPENIRKFLPTENCEDIP